MNERIRQLAEQATSSRNQYDPKTMMTERIQEFDKEKFAELIVLDTIKDCRDMFVVSSVSWNLLNEKLKHFGVEQ